jgi:hypothetical protein
MAEAATAGTPLPESAALPLVLAPAVGSAFLVLNVVLAVFKPRWPWRTVRQDSPTATSGASS